MHRIKLMEPERRRVRVDELAKRLSVTSDELLAVLRDELYEFVRHAQSYIEDPVFRRVVHHYGLPELTIEEVHRTPAERWREYSRPPAIEPVSPSGNWRGTIPAATEAGEAEQPSVPEALVAIRAASGVRCVSDSAGRQAQRLGQRCQRDDDPLVLEDLRFHRRREGLLDGDRSR